MNKLRIKDWEEFQAYHDGRSMLWLKLWVKLLDSERFNNLPEVEQAQLFKLWLYAAKKNNEMEDNPKWLRKVIHTKRPLNIEKFISVGYIERYDNGDPVYEPVQKRTKSYLDKIREDKRREDKYISIFDSARKLYQGKKRGNDEEFSNFVYHCKNPLRGMPVIDWKEALPFLEPAIRKQIAWRKNPKKGEFVPPWKNFKTWINQRCWTEEVYVKEYIICSFCGEEPATRSETKNNPYGVKYACRFYACYEKLKSWKKGVTQ